MEFNEALRRIVVRHGRLLVLFVLVPMLVVTALQLRNGRTYVSTARVQASATLPTTEVEANAMLSRVKAVATSGSVVDTALTKTKITDRTPAQLAHETTVSRLGGSAVFTVKVTDRNPRTAEKLAGALSEELVSFFNGSGNLLVTQLTDREHALQTERVRVAGELPTTTNAGQSGRLTAQLGSLDQQILDVQASLRAAQAAGLGDSTASLLSSAGNAVLTPPLTATDVALAGVGGLVTGLLTATLLETFRPHVAGQAAFGRELDSPVLGRLPVAGRRRRHAGTGARPTVDDETVVALRRAVTRTGAGTVVLTGPAADERMTALAAELQARLAMARYPGTFEAAGLRSGRLGGPHAAEPPAPESDPHERQGHMATLNPAHESTARENTEVRSATALKDGRVRVAAARSAVPAVRVRALHEVDDVSDGARHVLVAVEPDLPPYTELRRVRNLVATTGWPVIGVLGDPAPRRRPRRGERPGRSAEAAGQERV
jgi:capsular polysaccharide biosynthesis protein